MNIGKALLGKSEKDVKKEVLRADTSNVYSDQNPSPVIEVAEDGSVSYLNPAARTCFGDIKILSQDLPALASGIDFQAVKSSEGVSSTEVVIAGRDYEVKIAYFAPANSFRLFGIDVTDRVNTEKKLEAKLEELANAQTAMVNLLEDERLLQEDLRIERDRANQIIASMGEGLIVIDKNNIITIMNPTAARLLKVRREDVIGKKWTDLSITSKSGDIVPTGEQSFYYAMTKGMTVYTNIDDDHYYRTATGETFPIVSITAPLTSNGAVVGAVKVFRDATYEKESRAMVEHEVEERTKQLQEAKDKISEGWLQLQQEKIKLTASINALPIGFFLLDAQHNVIVANKALAMIMEIDQGTMNYQNIFGALGTIIKDAPNICPHCRGEYSEYEVSDIKYKRKILRVFSVPVMRGQDYVGAAILVEDQTEAKMLERSKDEFFAIASHELRTPLTAIRGNSSLIQEYFIESIKDPNLKEIIDDIHESSVRLIEIVNDFLDVGRLEQGKVTFSIEAFDLVDLVREVYHDLSSVAAERKLNLVFVEPQSQVINIKADKGKVKQIVTNLVGNSIKYTKEGSVDVKIETDDKSAKVVVHDTGVGISQENQSRLFGKFVQANEDFKTRDVTRGTGLGLYISRLLSEGMGCSVYLQASGLGKGSTFAFEAPLGQVS